MIKTKLTTTIDFIHSHLPIVRKLVPLQTFRYGAVGGINLVYGIVQYWFIYHFVIFKHDINIGFMIISAPVFTFLLNFVITFFTGFFLVRNIAFDESEVRKRTQLWRYLMVVGLNLCINYGGIKLLVEILGVYPSISNALIQIVTVNVSFFINKYFTFKA